MARVLLIAVRFALFVEIKARTSLFEIVHAKVGRGLQRLLLPLDRLVELPGLGKGSGETVQEYSIFPAVQFTGLGGKLYGFVPIAHLRFRACGQHPSIAGVGALRFRVDLYGLHKVGGGRVVLLPAPLNRTPTA